MQGNPRSDEKASTAELVASEAPAVLSWQKVIDETPTKKLAVSVLSYGGLVTVSMPYNEPGAVDLREALQEQTSEYLKMNTKFNPKYTDDLMKQASTSNDTKPPKVRVSHGRRRVGERPSRTERKKFASSAEYGCQDK